MAIISINEKEHGGWKYLVYQINRTKFIALYLRNIMRNRYLEKRVADRSRVSVCWRPAGREHSTTGPAPPNRWQIKMSRITIHEAEGRLRLPRKKCI
jgi:hypothetical protein